MLKLKKMLDWITEVADWLRPTVYEYMDDRPDILGVSMIKRLHVCVSLITFVLFYLTEHVIWSGIKLGPPRRLKFPEPSKIAEIASEKLKEITPDP